MIKLLLWQQRAKRELTLIELSKLTGISKSTLNNFENERTSPTLNQLDKISVALNCEITDLFEQF